MIEVATASHDVHIQHRAATAVRWRARVRHAAESLAMHSDTKSTCHGTVHLLMEVHHVQRITHLLLMHEWVAAGRIATLIDHHVVDAHLALPSTLLRGHRHVIRLVHRVLVRIGLMVIADLARFALRVLRLRIRILHDLVHVYFVAHRRWRLRVLLSVTTTAVIVEVIWILHSSQLMTLSMMDVVLASARGCTSRIRIDAADTIV